jgi:hypothetical protein
MTERQAQRMQWHLQATAVAKVGIVACATASSDTVTNAMDTITWRQSCTTNIDNDDDDNDLC